MIKVLINKIVRCPITKSFIARAARAAAKKEKSLAGMVEINIVGSEEIKKINKQYGGKNQITDVLSFAWREEKKIKSDLLGQIYICYPRVALQAKEFGVAAPEEFARMLIHGLLHLVSYDHSRAKEAKKMFALQEKIISHVYKTRYPKF